MALSRECWRSVSITTRWKFWLMTVAALVAIAVTVRLGIWQLHRAAQKENLQTAIETQGKLAPLDNRAIAQTGDLAAEIHRPVRLRGTWAQANTVFLDNRQMDAKPGFYVVTPLRLEESRQAVLVQRGWVQRNFQDRNQLPLVSTSAGIVEVEGRIEAPPSRLFDLGSDGQGPIRQNLDMTTFGRETGLSLLPVSVVQTIGSVDDGLQRHWPVPASGAGKNYGYAFQWFALSALIAILYGWFEFGKKYVARLVEKRKL